MKDCPRIAQITRIGRKRRELHESHECKKILLVIQNKVVPLSPEKNIVMKVYHGGYCSVEFPKVIERKFPKDFGTGFYCTELKRQAIRWAKRYGTPTLSIFEYKENKNLNILHFTEMTEEWLDFIICCRSGEKHDFDIVIGAMANDQIYNYISDYINGIITREQFWTLAKFKIPTHQIAFCNEKALECIKFIKYQELK
jgi:hypothetical protein